MSISDLIVVMKDGALRQSAKPQTVYDDPEDLFVAKFLGTPPVNVFAGTVKDGTLIVADGKVLSVPGVRDGEVTVGVRPEGFVPKPDGGLVCALERVEVLGRDTSLIFASPALEAVSGRAVVDAEDAAGLLPGGIRFALKPSKTLLFEKDSGKRIRIGNAEG